MEFTQRITGHVDGAGFSRLTFRVLADGKPTAIMHWKMTDGRPYYRLTGDEFRCGKDTFDALQTKNAGLRAWLEAHAESHSKAPA
jgi:hypothetical protein